MKSHGKNVNVFEFLLAGGAGEGLREAFRVESSDNNGSSRVVFKHASSRLSVVGEFNCDPYVHVIYCRIIIMRVVAWARKTPRRTRLNWTKKIVKDPLAAYTCRQPVRTHTYTSVDKLNSCGLFN